MTSHKNFTDQALIASLNDYLASLANLDVINQNEHTGRTPLENLLNQLKNQIKLAHINITHEGKRNQDGLGAPDFTVNHNQKHTVIGYIENKKIDENLNKILKSAQIDKYKKLSDNLILTDYLEWIWIYKDSSPVRVRLCESSDLSNKKFKLSDEKAREFESLIHKFFACEPEKIGTAKELAQKLARPAMDLKQYLIEQVEAQIKDEQSRDELYAVYDIFKEGLFEELETKDFADGFAQMLTYSIFLAKLNTHESLSLQNTKDHIPQAFSLIKTLGKFLDLLTEKKHSSIKWAVENILSVINNIDVAAIAESLNDRHGDAEKDPYIYFYEDFLKEYDAQSRVDRGVYYTPPAVVQFIVKNVSQLLEQDFGLTKGLANPKVKLLDFACGTGTFLFESFKQVLQISTKHSFEHNQMVEHLLKNFFGFEIMISSYIIAHLKLSQLLKEHGYDITQKSDKRIGVYLTNTLENKKDIQTNLFAKAVAEEGKKANEIKQDKDIIAIIGNPPYNVSSQNKLHDHNDLLAFHDHYKPSDEKNINSLSDDYIKFIAFAHHKINEAGAGVIGVIVNNSFLKGLTHRKMRNTLMHDFDKIYVLDLHGNARIAETAPDGSPDQNVFEIMQGVCVLLLVKNKKIADKGVFHLDLYGKRADKFKRLYDIQASDFETLPIKEFNQSFRRTRWGCERFKDDLSFFAPMNQSEHMFEYGNFWGLTDVFEDFSSGIQTGKDELFIQFSDAAIAPVVNDFKKLSLVQFKEKYDVKSTSGWTFDTKFTNDVSVENIAYRPFDTRKIVWTKALRRQFNSIMKHMIKGANLGVVFARNYYGQDNYDFALISNQIIDLHLIGGQSYLAPLYLYKTEKELIEERIEILKKQIKNKTASLINERKQLFQLQEQLKTASDELQTLINFKPAFAQMVAECFEQPSPETVLAFIYAQLHSPRYRREYVELLKIDFPRVDFDVNLAQFNRLAALGQQLIDAHLMKKIPDLPIGTCFCERGFDDVVVEKPRYIETDQRIYINKDCYFADVASDVWAFKIGGYQVLDKYIKERVGRVLSHDEISHVSNIVKVLGATITLMNQIDES